MDEVLLINYDTERPTVLGRDLHAFLEVETPYHKWLPRMTDYGFTYGIDYIEVSDKIVHNPLGGRPATDHQLTIPMAKEISMLQRNERGKQARQYFIHIEEAWNKPEAVMARALKLADAKLIELRQVNTQLQGEVTKKDQLIGELMPKANYVDWILNNPGTVTITQIAKDYGLTGVKMNALLHELGVQFNQSGQWLLYAKHHGMGYTHSETVPITRKDGRPDVKMNTKWTQKGRLFLYELLKHNEVLPQIEIIHPRKLA